MRENTFIFFAEVRDGGLKPKLKLRRAELVLDAAEMGRQFLDQRNRGRKRVADVRLEFVFGQGAHGAQGTLHAELDRAEGGSDVVVQLGGELEAFALLRHEELFRKRLEFVRAFGNLLFQIFVGMEQFLFVLLDLRCEVPYR